MFFLCNRRSVAFIPWRCCLSIPCLFFHGCLLFQKMFYRRGFFAGSFSVQYLSFSALTLLVGHQEKRPACENWVMWCWWGHPAFKKLIAGVLAWLSVWSEVQIVCIWSSWCHCHPQTPSSLASFKSRLVLPFLYRLTQVVLEKGPLNGCNSSSSRSNGSPMLVDWHDLCA